MVLQFKHKSLTSNFISLALIRAFNIISKFFLVYYLVRVLGEKNFGILTWSEAILQYFIIFINFGFNIFGAKNIVENKNDSKKLNALISSIYTIKTLFFFLSLLSLIVLYFSGSFQANYTILFILLLSTIGDLLFPIWYFQGVENLKPLSISVIIAKVILVLLTFLAVKASSETVTYVFIFCFSHILMGTLGFIALKKNINFSFLLPSKKHLQKLLKEATFYFVGNISMLIFNALTVFLIGLYISMEAVTGFDISLKIVMLGILPFEILQAVAMPKIAKNKNKKELVRLIFYSIIAGALLFFFLQIFGDQLLLLLGGSEIMKYRNVLKKLSYLSLFVPAGFMIGQCGLVAFGESKKYNFSLVTVAVLFCITVLILILNNQLNFKLLVNLRVFSDLLLFSLFIIQGFRSKIFNLK